MQINDQGTFYVEGEYKAGDTILTAGDWELKADVDGYKKYAFGYEPDDFPELVTNGTFDTDISGWDNAATAVAAWDGGRLKLTGDNSQRREQLLTGLVDGAVYKITGTIIDDTGTGALYYQDGAGQSLVAIGAGTHSKTFKLVGTGPKIQLYGGGTVGASCFFDNVSLKLAHPEAGDTIQLGNGHHKDFRYYPYKLSATEITELTR